MAGRTGLAAVCGTQQPKRDYLLGYAQDVCAPTGAPAKRRLGDRRALFGDAPYGTAAAAFAALHGVDGPPSPPAPKDAWLLGTTPTRNQSLATRVAVGGPLEPLEVAPDRTTRLASLRFEAIRGMPHPEGEWHTVLLSAVATRLEVVFTGIRQDARGGLSYAAFDGQPPFDPSRVSVRYTRFCEYTAAGCDGTCALIDAAGSTALRGGTLSLLQTSLHSACPFDVHVWVPLAKRDQVQCVGIYYITVANGDAGAFTGESACSRALSASPPTSPPSPTPSPTPSPPPPPPGYIVNPTLPPPPPTPPTPPMAPSVGADTPVERSVARRILVVMLLLVLIGGMVPQAAFASWCLCCLTPWALWTRCCLFCLPPWRRQHTDRRAQWALWTRCCLFCLPPWRRQHTDRPR